MKLKKISKKQYLTIVIIATVILACLTYVIHTTNIFFSGQALVYSAQAETMDSMRLRIPKLVKGDKIYVDNGKGSTTVFVVREFRVYKADEDASDVFVSKDGKSHLNLITCNGSWDSAKKNRPNRLVVFADME